MHNSAIAGEYLISIEGLVALRHRQCKTVLPEPGASANYDTILLKLNFLCFYYACNC